MKVISKAPGLGLLADARGSVVLGRLGADVIYARLEGGLSADLGHRFATRLEQLVQAGGSFDYFSDARAVTHYDLLARSAFIRVAREQRARFRSLTMLTWAEGVSQAAEVVTQTIGGDVALLTDSTEFETRLLRHAPAAEEVLAAGHALGDGRRLSYR